MIACAAEGMFNNVTLLMDKAVQEVKELEEAENYVRDHYLATRRADRSAATRKTTPTSAPACASSTSRPGTFNLNTSNIADASGTWDSDSGMADDYMSKMGHGFGNGFWGEPMEDVFRLALRAPRKSCTEFDDALRRARQRRLLHVHGRPRERGAHVDGEDARARRHQHARSRKPEMSSIDEFIGTEFRSRYVNPTWIEGMKKEGYAGAGAMREFVEYMWGWDATVTETVDDAMWQETFDVYVEDKHELGMKQFFDEKSPFAFQDIAARMIETVRKDYWQADAGDAEDAADGVPRERQRARRRLLRQHLRQPAPARVRREQALAAGVPCPTSRSSWPRWSAPRARRSRSSRRRCANSLRRTRRRSRIGRAGPEAAAAVRRTSTRRSCKAIDAERDDPKQEQSAANSPNESADRNVGRSGGPRGARRAAFWRERRRRVS